MRLIIMQIYKLYYMKKNPINDLKRYFKLIYIMFFIAQIALIILPFNLTASLSGQDYYNKDYTRNSNFIYKENIHTVLLNKDGFELSDPIIKLNSNEKLHLSFDDLSEETKTFKYTLRLCDADWQDTELDISRYIDGFTEDLIEDYEFSLNTTQPLSI